MTPQNKKEAIEVFGKEKVASVISMVNTIGEADGVYTAFEDEGDEDACAIIEMLYFNTVEEVIQLK